MITTNPENPAIYQEGGCLCGAVRYRTTSSPVRAMACHCSSCKRRTGAAFGVGIYFNDTDVELFQGDMGSYQFCSSTTGRWIRNEFCAACATTLSWTLEMRPGLRAIAGGSYDNPDWFSIEAHIWTESACQGICYPTGIEVHPQALPR